MSLKTRRSPLPALAQFSSTVCDRAFRLTVNIVIEGSFLINPLNRSSGSHLTPLFDIIYSIAPFFFFFLALQSTSLPSLSLSHKFGCLETLFTIRLASSKKVSPGRKISCARPALGKYSLWLLLPTFSPHFPRVFFIENPFDGTRPATQASLPL